MTLTKRISLKANTLLVLIFTCLAMISKSTQAQSPGDLANILHYEIHLNASSYSSQNIGGKTIISFLAKQEQQSMLKLELWNLTVDSVIGNQVSTWDYDGQVITINYSLPLLTQDTNFVTVYYNGHPAIDASGWGGFYFQSGIIFNLGVGFDSNPHNLGKAWFPCVDTFTDRAKYDYYITAAASALVTCSGVLQGIVINATNSLHHWKLLEEIPTYLASVAISNYVLIEDTFAGIERPIPVSYYLTPDVAGNINSFQNLEQALQAFENRYGPYRWPRIGYVNTPVGAMEHACNVAFPTSYVNGGLSGERTMAHELGHAWFGNLITCETAEDMWINEGWASFMEEDFMEFVYGKAAAKNFARSRHNLNLRTLQHEDGYIPLYGIPNELTYSTTIYKKGADMAHTLRGYMGDSIFYESLRSLMIDSAFRDISVAELNSYLSQKSGINLSPFFDAHIYQPGWLHFSIDSIQQIPAGNGAAINVFVRQRTKEAPQILQHSRLRISFLKEDWTWQTEWFEMNGASGMQSYILDFDPIDVILDLEEEYMDATTDVYTIFKAGDGGTLVEEYFKYDIFPESDSAFVRVEQNWIAPDSFQNPHPDLILSNSRYWKIQGDFPTGFAASFKFNYNNETTYNGMLDYTWFPYPLSADSLILLYRSGAGKEWEPISFIRQGTSRNGYLSTSDIRRGEYTMAYRDRSLAIGDIVDPSLIKVYPNPAVNEIHIETQFQGEMALHFMDSLGRLILGKSVPADAKQINIPISHLPNGVYLLRLSSEKKILHQSKIVVKK
jgi:hypothetical protein